LQNSNLFDKRLGSFGIGLGVDHGKHRLWLGPKSFYESRQIKKNSIFDQ
jgi:hypothetical protein